jgi:putative transposase
MVRAGVVRHPAEWAHDGYRQIQNPPEHYPLIELADLSDLCGLTKVANFQRANRQWVEIALARESVKRDERWSEAIALGSQAFVEKVKRDLGTQAKHREVDEPDGTCVLSEPRGAYTTTLGTENSALRPENATLWTENPADA